MTAELDDPDPAPVHVFDRPVDGLSLDVGGVLVLPDQSVLADALRREGITFDEERFTEGHYRAMAEVDRCGSDPETFGDYQRGYLRTLGVPEDRWARGSEIMGAVLGPQVWHQPIPGAIDAARRLARAGLALGLTSNADGTIEETLRTHGIAQVGPGTGLEVACVTDSGVLGKHKPDPAMFLTTAAALDLAPERVCHIGDSACFDTEGAAAVGMVAVHVDPLGECPGSHHHVASLAELADLVEAQADGGAR